MDPTLTCHCRLHSGSEPCFVDVEQQADTHGDRLRSLSSHTLASGPRAHFISNSHKAFSPSQTATVRHGRDKPSLAVAD